MMKMVPWDILNFHTIGTPYWVLRTGYWGLGLPSPTLYCQLATAGEWSNVRPKQGYNMAGKGGK